MSSSAKKCPLCDKKVKKSIQLKRCIHKFCIKCIKYIPDVLFLLFFRFYINARYAKEKLLI